MTVSPMRIGSGTGTVFSAPSSARSPVIEMTSKRGSTLGSIHSAAMQSATNGITSSA
jgi:hypothetical protein